MAKLDILTIGAATVDAFLSIHNAHDSCRINTKEKELCIRYGEKIPVDSCVFSVGGNACNVAIGLSRLGYTAGICAEIGDDEFAQKIKNTLQKETVDTSYLLEDKNSQSSFAIGINFNKERTLFVSHTKRDHNFSFQGLSTKWVYLTSLGEEWKQAYLRVYGEIKNRKINLAFNPGTKQIEEGYESIKSLLQITQVIFLNKEESNKILFGDDEERYITDIKRLLQEIHETGPEIVVITDGENGSYALNTDGRAFHLKAFPTTVVEKTGAGDAFASGFLGSFIKNGNLENALVCGAIQAGSVVSFVGSQEGLLTLSAIQNKVESHKEFAVRSI